MNNLYYLKAQDEEIAPIMNNLYYLKAQDEEIALSAEELLTMFNRNISKNTELLNYIGRRNLGAGGFSCVDLS